jgi:hypothetical protein
MTEADIVPTPAAPAPEAPPAAVSRRVRVCPECGTEFEPPAKGPGQHKRFHDPACRTAWANREKAQGAVLITVAKIWREFRGSGRHGRAAFAEMTSILDILISADKKAGRLSFKSPELEPFVRDVLADPYLDRRR